MHRGSEPLVSNWTCEALLIQFAEHAQLSPAFLRSRDTDRTSSIYCRLPQRHVCAMLLKNIVRATPRRIVSASSQRANRTWHANAESCVFAMSRWRVVYECLFERRPLSLMTVGAQATRLATHEEPTSIYARCNIAQCLPNQRVRAVRHARPNRHSF